VSVTYRAVGWNAQKRAYDAFVAIGCLLYLTVFAAGMLVVHPQATIETLIIRGTGSLAFLMLHVILSIGPLCRLDPRFLPLLYNRRHLGVTMASVALVHGVFSIVQFHGFAGRYVLVSVLSSSAAWTSVSGFPFQITGFVALAIIVTMAATSHDFWLQTLTPRIWKSLHMTVYAAYALLVVHVAFGALQSETDVRLTAMVTLGVAWIVGLHLLSARREARLDRHVAAAPDHFVDVCAPGDIPDGRARIVCAGGERIAVFRYDGKVSAIANVCQHQNGPLGEGRIVRGCVVCPWHGYEYRPDSGASPPPFTEKVATFAVEIRQGRVRVDPRPHPPGTRLEPAVIP
jgi:nitrite reductase/ring-hydroxylating ferredoxin subunit/DMSO/TMAO reductase YedYZ heme-binding membrane subunit